MNKNGFSALGAGVLFIGLLSLLAAPAFCGSANDTKIAYTRDGIHFISKERVAENIRYEYARPGEYREVAVPIDTIVVGASTIPENLTDSDEVEDKAGSDGEAAGSTGASEEEVEGRPEGPDVDRAQPKSGERYPYASVSIGALIICGALVFVGSLFSGRRRR